MTVQEICVVVDRSGSMRGKETDTVGGINAMLDALKASKTDEDTINVSLKLFDHTQIMKLKSVKISDVTEFLVSEFIPRGQTALLDALGDSIRYFMEKKLSNPNAYDTCLVYVATDGLENASSRYNKYDIKKLIETAEQIYNIKIVYLGANQDAILEASTIGISSDSAINYCETGENIAAVYRSAAAVASRDRSNPFDSPSFTPIERQSSVTTTPIERQSRVTTTTPIERQASVTTSTLSQIRPPPIQRQPLDVQNIQQHQNTLPVPIVRQNAMMVDNFVD